ncbi:polysaccharide pyruvyl transferase family protein [Vibrio sp. YIC-376]|uniref:polysaccharide pyruvyl transferase family protein n=1 Tax=Vibrio sp. YIC-376 TaxID=3136162 RepID=UPI00402A737D
MKIVVSNVFGPLNLGDFELFKRLVDIVERESVEISAIAREPKLSNDFFPNIEFYEQIGKSEKLYLRLLYLLSSLMYAYIPSLSKLILPKSQYNALVSLKNSDVVIACPGGFLEDSSFSFYAHIVQLYVATQLSKKVILAPMSIGPARSKLNRTLIKSVLRKANKIYVRELVSANLCKDLNIDYILSNDLAFDIQHKYSKERSNRALFTIINWNFPTSPNAEQQLDNYLNSLVTSAIHLHNNYGLEIGVIQQVASDRPAIDRFVELLSRHNITVIVEGDGYTPEQIMNLISSVKVVVASRFHSAIFSLNVKTPVVPISYLPKTSGMLDLYDCSDLYLDIVDLDSKLLISKLDKLLNDPEFYANLLNKLKFGLNNYKRFEDDSFNGWS